MTSDGEGFACTCVACVCACARIARGRRLSHALHPQRRHYPVTNDLKRIIPVSCDCTGYRDYSLFVMVCHVLCGDKAGIRAKSELLIGAVRRIIRYCRSVRIRRSVGIRLLVRMLELGRHFRHRRNGRCRRHGRNSRHRRHRRYGRSLRQRILLRCGVLRRGVLLRGVILRCRSCVRIGRSRWCRVRRGRCRSRPDWSAAGRCRTRWPAPHTGLPEPRPWREPMRWKP